MAEQKIQGIRKSLSSWSLSTVKRPKIVPPKLKKANFKKIFAGKRKNRAEEGDQNNSEQESKEAFLDVSDSKSTKTKTKTKTHDPQSQSKIYASVHEPKPAENSQYEANVCPSLTRRETALNTKPVQNEERYIDDSFTSPRMPRSIDGDTSFISSQSSTSSPYLESNPYEESSDEEILFIDDPHEEERTRGGLVPCAVELNISPDEYYSWFDAQEPSLQTDPQIPLTVEGEEEYSNYLASEYFDARGSRTITPASGKSYEDIEVPPHYIPRPGSARARDWVKSFNEDALKQGQQTLEKKQQPRPKQRRNLPRSRSEVRLNDGEIKEKKKDEIILNTQSASQSSSTTKRLLHKLFSRESKKPSAKIESLKPARENANAEMVKKENIKNIFGEEEKLPLKTPHVEDKESTNLASTSNAVTGHVNKENIDKEQNSKGFPRFLETSLDADENITVAKSAKLNDDSDELLEEIEKYLSTADNYPTPVPNATPDRINTRIDEMEMHRNTINTDKKSFLSNLNNHDGTCENQSSNAKYLNLKEVGEGKVSSKEETIVGEESKFNTDTTLNESISTPQTNNSVVLRNSKADLKNKESTNPKSNRFSAIGIISEIRKNSALSILSDLKRNVSVNQIPNSQRQSVVMTSENDELTTEEIDSGHNAKSPSVTAKAGSEAENETESLPEENKRQNPGAYITKTFKNIKENVRASDFKEKIKFKEEKKKVMSLFNPILPGNIFKNSGQILPDNHCENIVPESYCSDESVYGEKGLHSNMEMTKNNTTQVEAKIKSLPQTCSREDNLQNDVDTNEVSKTTDQDLLGRTNNVAISFKIQPRVNIKESNVDDAITKVSSPDQTRDKREMDGQKITPSRSHYSSEDENPRDQEVTGQTNDRFSGGQRSAQASSVVYPEKEAEGESNVLRIEVKGNYGEGSNHLNDPYAKVKKIEIESSIKLDGSENIEDANVDHENESQRNLSVKESHFSLTDEQNDLNRPIISASVSYTIESENSYGPETQIYENQNNVNLNLGEASGCGNKVELDEPKALKNEAIATCDLRPQPIPRARKSKPGLCMDSDKHPPNHMERRKMPIETEMPTIAVQENPQRENIQERVVVENLETPKPMANKRTLRDPGYGNSDGDENNGVNDPIYWEIGDQPSSSVSSVPKVSLRKVTNDRSTRSTQDISKDSKGSATKLPNWIQQRPPIPSPRTKKTTSTQSLVQRSTSSGLDDPGVTVFGSSFTNLDFSEPGERRDSKWAGEAFYSGKAASIAYGVTTPCHQPLEKVMPSPLIQPTLPPRSKKTSMTSLPDSIPVEEPSVLRPGQQPLERFPRIFGSKDLAQKRLRRRTSPDVPPKAAPRRILKPPLAPRKTLQESLEPFMKSGSPGGGGVISPRKSEDILEETLFSVNSIMGPDLGGTWGVEAKGGAKGGYNVTLGEVRNHLKAAFQVSPETFEAILEKVHRREAANVTLTLNILEASDLRAKTVKGGSNPYVTIDIPGTGQNYRTTTQHETLNPKWKEEFKLKVKNLNQDIVKLQIWHDFDPKLTSQVLAVKDLASFSRLIKGTTAIAHKHEHHLLGSVTVPLKDIRERGLNDWFPIVKDPLREGVKQRGSLLVNAFVTASLKSVSGLEAQRSHDAILARLIYHHIKTATNNNTEEDIVHIPWHGQLSPEANAAVVQHAIILGLKPALQNLSWWIVVSRVPTVDGGWLLNQLKIVQKHLTDGVYDVSAIESLADSYAIWIDNSIQRIRTLNKSFPPQSGVVAKQQFAYTVDIFLALENHKESIGLLERKEIKNLKNEVKEALMVYMKIWWTELLERHLKGETKKEIEVQSIIAITSDVYDFLCEIQSFYSPILLKEMNIKLFREMYLLATKKLKHCVHPPILNLYNHLENISEQQTEDIDDGKPSYTLQDGTNLWQLYVNLGRINKLGIDLPIEIRKESGIYEYHRWFNRGVRRWVDLARKRALQMIERAVELDNLVHVDEYCKFSSSATDVSGIFTDVKIWWHKLEWPDPENSTILLAKILEDICSYGMRYADLLKKKVEGLFSSQSTADQLVISQQICTGLNNIERVRDELTRLPDAFGVRFLSEKVQMSQTGGQDASVRFTNNIKTLIEHSSENMEGKVIEFIEAVIEKMTMTLHDAVIQSCDASSEKHLLEVVLDPAIQLICNEMSDGNFKRFLQRLWEGLVHLFALTVKRNTDKRKASYFNGVYQILECCFKFFSPSNGAGIDHSEAKSQAYVDLMKLLECLRLTTENLISRYYSERYEEQKACTNEAKGELVVRTLFTKAGKLIVEIIMAKDMHLSAEGAGFVSKHTLQASIDSYVKMQCVPSDWFPNIHEARTKTMKKSDPAVFDETFEFELKKEDNGVSSGFLLFTLKDYNLGRSNTFIGEAMVSLSELDCVDSSSVHSIQNTYLKVTQPKHESGYHSLRALALRSGDRTACAFLKKLQSRLNCTRLKVSTSGLSSDEEKPKPKSPRLLRKIMNN